MEQSKNSGMYHMENVYLLAEFFIIIATAILFGTVERKNQIISSLSLVILLKMIKERF